MARKEVENEQPTRYTKQQFLGSEKYASQKDVLYALLEDDKTYSSDTVDQLVNKFMKQEAK